MVATILNNTEELPGFYFYDDSVVIECRKIFGHRLFDNQNIKKINNFVLTSPKTLNLISSDKKVLISLLSGPYHFFMNSVASLIKIYKNNENLFFILDAKNIKEQDWSLLNFLSDILNDNNIKHRVINTEDYDYLLINNFYYLEDVTSSIAYSNEILNISKKYLKDITATPNKKVYLSRSKIPDRSFNNINLKNMHKMPFLDDNRVIDENVLENFFRENNFEIVVPENFINFKEQLNYFYSVKTLVSVTSSGITNSIFMQEGGNVVELITPLTVFFWNSINENGVPDYTKVHSEQHHFYHAMSFLKNHNYVSIPNKTRKSEDLINKFLQNKFLKDLLE